MPVHFPARIVYRYRHCQPTLPALFRGSCVYVYPTRTWGEAIMAKWFTRFSTGAARLSGHYLTFIIALGLIIVWAVSGPLFGFTDTWQLVINTGTTIITFLMVFLIQNTQNRDSKAIHVKLDEIIRAMDRSDNTIIAAEEDSDEELDTLEQKFEHLRDDA